MIQRRSFLLGLGAMFAAPAVVRAASLMPVSAPRLFMYRNRWPTIEQITREAVELFNNSNALLRALDRAYAYDNMCREDPMRISINPAWVIENRSQIIHGNLRVSIPEAV